MTFHEVLLSSPTLPLGRKWPAQLIPIILRKSLNILGPSAFVSPSVSISLVEMYEITISFRSTFSLIQYHRTSICFVFRWNSEFSVNEIASLLSARRSTGWLRSRNPREVKNCEIHRASFSASVVAIYSASVDDKATVLCNFNWWDKGPPDNMNIYWKRVVVGVRAMVSSRPSQNQKRKASKIKKGENGM